MAFSNAVLVAFSAAALSAAVASAEEQTLRFKLVVSMTSNVEMQLASVTDRALTTNEAVGVAYFDDGRVAFKQFVVSSLGGAEDGSFMGLSTYTFQNGDALTLKFTGGWAATGQGGDYEVLSGKGAFEGATGTGRFDALEDAWDDADLFEGSFELEVPES